jgi:tight adherence protein C
MLPITIAATLFCFLMLLISWYGYRRYSRPGRFYKHLGTEAVVVNTGLEESAGPRGGLAISVFEQIGQQVPISPQDAAMTRRILIAAGLRSDTAVAVHYGIKIVLCVTLFVLAIIFRDHVTAVPLLRIVFVIAAGLAGYFGPNLYLEHMVSKRQEELRLSLPDALDLMVVCVEAGLALDQAILNVSRELAMTHPALCGELSLVNLEMRAGKRRSEALRNLAERTGESELRKLVAILIQTDRFGTSIAESLRTHSDFMRVRRRQDAEERAGKVGVKLVFPIFFFLLPSMLVVAAGPGLLQVFKYLFPLMRSFGH